MSKQAGHQGRVAAFQETDLKICDLCGCLNLESNPECFVCGWHGHFERSAEIVHAAMELAVRRYGRLELYHVTDPHTYRQPLPPTFRKRLRNGLLRVWRWICG